MAKKAEIDWTQKRRDCPWNRNRNCIEIQKGNIWPCQYKLCPFVFWKTTFASFEVEPEVFEEPEEVLPLFLGQKRKCFMKLKQRCRLRRKKYMAKTFLPLPKTFSNDPSYIELNGTTQRETPARNGHEGAVLIDFGEDEPKWVPKSVLEDWPDVGDNGDVILQKWYVIIEGLI